MLDLENFQEEYDAALKEASLKDEAKKKKNPKTGFEFFFKMGVDDVFARVRAG